MINFDPHSLFAYAQVQSVVSQNASTIVVNLTVGSGAYFQVGQQICFAPPSTVIPLKTNSMIGRITGIVGDQVTCDITSGNREGSAQFTVAAGWQFANPITPKAFLDIENAINALPSFPLGISSGGTGASAPGGARTNLGASPVLVTKTVGFANADYIATGTADDVPIQQAINAVSAAGGGIVYIKEGTYNITNNNANPYFQSSYAPYVGVTIPSNVALRGAGRGRTILNLASFVAGLNERFVMFCNTGANQANIEISDLSIQLPAFVTGGSAYWGSAIEIAGASRVILKNLYIVNSGWRFDGNSVSFNSTTNQLTTDAQDIVVDNVNIFGQLGSCALFSTRNVIVRDCTIRQAADDPLLIANAGQQIKIINFYTDGSGGVVGAASGGIYISSNTVVTTSNYGMSDILILGCQIRNLLAGNGITIAGTGGVRELRIIGNDISNNPGVGILLQQRAQNVTIVGNVINYNQKTGAGVVYFGGVNCVVINSGDYMKNINIANNIISDNSTNGIYIGGTTGTTINGITITGNEIFDDQGTPTQTSGIVVSAGGLAITNIVLNLNNVHDTTTPYTWTLGGGSVSGGSLYLVSGALTYRGGSATTTTVAAA